MKKNLLLSFFLVFSVLLFAQKQTIQGTVTDGKAPLPGVSIAVKGTTAGTVTDIDGVYKIDAEDGATLVFSFVGFYTQEIPLTKKRFLDVVLLENTENLNEVVIVAYGTQAKSDLTGSVSSIKAKDIQGIATGSVDQALQGKFAGVLVTPTDGTPGAAAIIRIRGTGTLNNSNPLFVVDGLLIDDINFLNPNDIETVTVLKDASSTALYGTRGANGVILITTKHGKAGKGQISVSSYYGTQELSKKIALTNASQYGVLRNAAAKNFNQPTPFPNPETLGVGTDWQEAIFQKAPIKNLNLAARGGNEFMTYSISGDYLKQDGILKGGDFERYTLRINNEYKLNKFIKLGHNISILSSHSNYSPGMIYNAYYAPPTAPTIDSAGKFGNTTSDGNVGNPLAQLYYERYNSGSSFRALGNVYADITVFKGLTFRTSGGIDYNTDESKKFVPVFFVTDIQKLDHNTIDVARNKNVNKLWENTLTFDKIFGKHHLNLLAGLTAQTQSGNRLTAHGTDLLSDVNNINADIESLLYLRNAQKGITIDEIGTNDANFSIFSQLYRINYTLNERYLFTASLRRDGSSKFAPNRRFGNFPAVAVGWRLKEENWFKNLDWLSALKFRASYGVIGNDKVPQTAFKPPVTSRLDAIFGPDEKFFPGATINQLANPDLHWEETHQTDIGFEAGFFKNRLTTEIDWYNRKTLDIITQVAIPAYVGAQDPPFVNAASLVNSGFDFNLGWRDKTQSNFGYNINVIVSTVHNEILSLGEGKTEIFGGSVGEGGKLGTRTTIGSSIGAYYGYKVAGVYQNAEDLKNLPKRVGEVAGSDVKIGDLVYQDTDGDGVITAKDRVFLGSAIPTYTFSVNLGADYAGFDASIQISGVGGNKVMNAKRLARFSTGNFESSFLNGWTETNPSNFEPRVTIGGRNYEVSDRFIEDGSFTSIRNLQIGYTLPASIAKTLKMQNLRIYVAATNLKMWTKYSGYTPEITNGGDSFSPGIDRGVYPVGRTYTVGVNVTF